MSAFLQLSEPAPGQAGDVPWRRPPPPAAPPEDPEPDLLVIGAGLAGLAVAAEARRRGIGRVSIIDPAGIAVRASGRNAGALIPDANALTMPAPFAALARRGLALHRELHERWRLPLRDLDWLVPVEHTAGPAPAGLPRTADAAAAGLPRTAALLDRRTIASRLGTPTSLERAVLVRDQAATDPVEVATALARDAGGVAAVGATGLRLEGGRVTEVTTTTGPLRPAATVLATGQAPTAVVPGQRWVTGHLALTAPVDLDLGGAALGGTTIVVPQPDGRLLVGGSREAEHDGAVRPEVVERIRTALGRLVPAAADVPFEHVWTGQRPVSRDELPIVDRLPGAGNAYLIAGLHHSGLCTAPAIAEAVVEAVVSGRLPDAVAAFAINR